MNKTPQTKKKTEGKEELPAWFNNDNDKVNPNSEEQIELDNILKELV